MAIGDQYTTGLKDFINNNANAGYIRTSSEITTSDIAAAVSQIIGNEYVKSNQLAQVATSGNYNHLSNLPTLHSVATSGDYMDLTNRPVLHAVATSGDYNSLANRPDIEGRVDSEVNTLITTAISAAKTEIKGANVGANYNTLEKLQNIKSEIVYMDVTSTAYGSLSNFGNQSFYNTNLALINAIINNYLNNKIIILQSNYGNFVVSNFLNNNSYCEVSLIKLKSNYLNLEAQFEIDNPSGTLNDYILANIKLTYDEIYIIYDKTKSLIFYINNNNTYLSQTDISDITTTLTNHTTGIATITTTTNNLSDSIANLSDSMENLNRRISALEEYHSTPDPDEPEPEEP